MLQNKYSVGEHKANILRPSAKKKKYKVCKTFLKGMASMKSLCNLLTEKNGVTFFYVLTVTKRNQILSF